MNTLQFETDVQDQYIKLPNFRKFLSKHIKVTIEETEQVSKNNDTEFWNAFIKKTAGSFANSSLTRPEQGTYEIREEL